jgi:hypothetical protein
MPIIESPTTLKPPLKYFEAIRLARTDFVYADPPDVEFTRLANNGQL